MSFFCEASDFARKALAATRRTLVGHCRVGGPNSPKVKAADEMSGRFVEELTAGLSEWEKHGATL